MGTAGVSAALFLSGPIGWGVGAVVLAYTAGTIIWDATHEEP